MKCKKCGKEMSGTYRGYVCYDCNVDEDSKELIQED